MFEEILTSNLKIIQAFIENEFQKLTENNQNEFINLLQSDGRKNVNLLAKRLLKAREKEIKELERQKLLWKYENYFINQGYSTIAGTDEVGRGPIAGPVVAAAVILPVGLRLDDIDDSKKLSEKKRLYLNEVIKEKAIAYQISEFDSQYIDKTNILNASKLAMAKSVAALSKSPNLILVDGNYSIPIDLPQKFIVKGDSLSVSIAAASILAKVYRDNLMREYDELYPEYDFKGNKGYGTKAHYEAIKKYGLTPWHRRSFSLEAYEVRDDRFK